MTLLTALVAAALTAGGPQAEPATAPSSTPRAASAGVTMGKAATAAPRGRSLAEVARTVKLNLPQGASQVITNENLKSLSAGVELTTGTVAPPADAGRTADLSASAEADRKAYWQDRYFAARREVDTLAAEEIRLSAEVARLEREFYARDDPYQRDTVIKPAWDEALVKLRDVQKRLPEARKAPESIANEARRAGALPGWFREAPSASPASPQGAPAEPQH